MFKLNRLGIVLALAALAALEFDLHLASAQRRRGVSTSGGSSSSSSSSSGNNQTGNQQNNDNDNNNNDSDKDKKKGSGQSTSNSTSNQSGQSNTTGSGGSNSGATTTNSNNNSGNNTSGGVGKSSQQGIQQFQQMIQNGNNSTSTQTMRGTQSSNNRGQGQNQGQSQFKIQGQGQGQNQSNSQQVQNFQPWQMWQGQGQGNNRGNNRGNQQNYQKKNSNWFIQLGGGPEPYSLGWYEKHPQTWHWKHNDNDAWKVATAAGVVGWLGWGQPYYQTQVIYEPQPVIVFDPEAQGPWMPLGVYSLLTGPSDTGTRILQLSINPQGYIRGSYYDMITDDTYNLRGRADQSTQYIQWSLDTNQSLMFYTPLYQLTQSQGVINVRLPGGTQQWQVVRMEYAQ